MYEGVNKLEKKIIKLSDRLGFKLALFSAAMMTTLSSIVIAPALPQIAQEFKDTPNIELLTGLVLSIPALFVMLISPIAGALMDKFGKIKFLYPAMVVWILAGVSGYFMQSIYALLLSRCVFGMATAFITTGANALLGDYYTIGKGRKEKALSLQGFTLALGGAVLTIIAGYLASISWHYVFFVYASGVLIFIFCLIYLFEPRVYKKADENKQIKQEFKLKPFLALYFMGFFIMVIYYLAGIQFPHYIEDLGLSAKYIGLAMATPILSYGIFSYLYKDIARFFSMKQIYVVALIIEAFGFLLVFCFNDFVVAIVSLFLFGMVGALIVTNNSSYLFAITPSTLRARAYSILASCMFFGQFMSPIITTPMVKLFGLKTEFMIWVGVILLVAVIYSRLSFKKA